MRREVGTVLSLTGLWIALVSWALVMPVGSSPDDDYHLASIWCVGSNTCEQVDERSLSVPAAVVGASDCFRFDSSVPATCAESLVAGELSSELRASDRVNQRAGLYPEGFYSFAHLFVGPDIERSVTVIRIVNATLAVLALAWIAAVARRGVRRAALVAVTVAWVPMGLWILPSTNPSSWTFTGLLLVGAMTLSAWLSPTSRKRWLSVLGVVVGGVMATGSRVDAAAFTLIVIVAASAYVGWRQVRGNPWVTTVILAVGVWAALAFVFGQSAVPTEEGARLGGSEPGSGLLLTNLTYVLIYVQGVVGGWPLFWNDTVLPPSVPVIGTIVLGVVAGLGMRRMGARKGLALAVGASALVLVPLIFLQMHGLGVGEMVQPRYLAPLLLLCVLVLLLPTSIEEPGTVDRIGPGLRWTVIAALTFSATLTWWVSVHRFTYGSDAPLFDNELLRPHLLGLVITAAAGAVWIAGAWLGARDHDFSRARMMSAEEER